MNKQIKIMKKKKMIKIMQYNVNKTTTLVKLQRQ